MYLAANTAQCATAGASEKVTREPLKRLIATSVYLHVLLSAIHWILESFSPSPSVPQYACIEITVRVCLHRLSYSYVALLFVLRTRVSREHLMCAHETPSYWLARWWRLERAFLDVARAQQLPPLDSSGAGASSPLCPSQLGSNLKLLADYPLLGRLALSSLAHYASGISLRLQYITLLHLCALVGTLPAAAELRSSSSRLRFTSTSR